MRKREIYALADALAAAEALADPSSSCGVDKKAREAAALYVRTWIAPFLREALRSGITGDSGLLRQIYRDGKGVCRNPAAVKILDDLHREAKQ